LHDHRGAAIFTGAKHFFLSFFLYLRAKQKGYNTKQAMHYIWQCASLKIEILDFSKTTEARPNKFI